MTEQPTRDQPMTNHDRMNYWWRRATQAEAELDSWMTRAYEAEGKLWKAEARIKHLEDTARVLVKEALSAEAERDSARGYISELESAMQSRNDVIKHRDARIKAVRDVLDEVEASSTHMDIPWVAVEDIRRALESVPPPSA